MSEGVKAHPYLYHMVLNPEDPEDRLVSASKGAYQAHSTQSYSTVYRKTGNEPWKEISEGLPCDHSFTHNLAADPSETEVFYALNNNGLYRLDSNENHWEELNIDWKEDYLDQRSACFAVKEYE